jgi:hypothetical protein
MLKRLMLLPLLLALALLAACSTMPGLPLLELSLAQLQDALSRRLPLNSRYLEFFDVRLANPRLGLRDGRLAITLDAAIKPAMMPSGWNGSFGVSGVPRIDLAKRAVLLSQVKVDSLNVNGLPPAYSQQLGKLGSSLAERFVTDLPIYTFGANDFQFAGLRFQPANINTTANGLVITFEPAR